MISASAEGGTLSERVNCPGTKNGLSTGKPTRVLALFFGHPPHPSTSVRRHPDDWSSELPSKIFQCSHYAWMY